MREVVVLMIRTAQTATNVRETDQKKDVVARSALHRTPVGASSHWNPASSRYFIQIVHVLHNQNELGRFTTETFSTHIVAHASPHICLIYK